MFTKKIIAAGLLGIAALTAVPAQAEDFRFRVTVGQPGYGSHHPGYHQGRPSHGGWDRHDRHQLSPQQVRRILRSQGYREIRLFDRQGRTYQARAEDFRGRDYRLVISARSGQILDRQRIRG